MIGPKYKGFTLIEVVLAMAIFAGFATTIAIFQSAEMKGSAAMREELLLNSLATMKISELKVNQPELGISKTLLAETGEFDDYPDYKYSITYKALDFTNLDVMLLSNENEEDASSIMGLRSVVRMISSSLEEVLWMVVVTVEGHGYQTSLSAWLVKKDRGWNVL